MRPNLVGCPATALEDLGQQGPQLASAPLPQDVDEVLLETADGRLPRLDRLPAPRRQGDQLGAPVRRVGPRST